MTAHPSSQWTSCCDSMTLRFWLSFLPQIVHLSVSFRCILLSFLLLFPSPKASSSSLMVLFLLPHATPGWGAEGKQTETKRDRDRQRQRSTETETERMRFKSRLHLRERMCVFLSLLIMFSFKLVNFLSVWPQARVMGGGKASFENIPLSVCPVDKCVCVGGGGVV